MDVDRQTAAEKLATPVQFVAGVGPRVGPLLHRLGLYRASDLLFFFPRDYEDLTELRQIGQLEEGKLQTVRGTVEDIEFRALSGGRCVLGVSLRCEDGYLRAVWFNQPFMQERFAYGQHLLVSGKPRYRGLVWEMAHPRVQVLASDEPADEPAGGLLPVYTLTEGLPQWRLRRIMRSVIETYTELLEEVFPEAYLEGHQLWPIHRAVAEVHFPSDRHSLEQARRRFIYQELFILQLALAIKRYQQRSLARAPVLETTAKIDARIRRLFPFELTASQRRAIAEVTRDMASPVPMNRLLQGDVGSGKTVVALYAMLVAVAHGYQAALMAPTEVLARQHAQTIERLLAASHVRRAQLMSGLGGKQRSGLLEAIAAGDVDLVVGTHAIIQHDVRFHRLGLVVIDEQHKFGVRQRAELRQAGTDPHYLVMTATPIPRSVAMTLFGDLDVSTLTDSPPGRQTVRTYWPPESKRDAWWKFFATKLREGRQGYVVVPLVEESEQVEAKSLNEIFESLANGPLEAFRLGLIHGRMSLEEKDAVMDKFRQGETQVLVCTSVVEVGVDVPNATLMTIESGHRFGLAQLHQLRGRISRGRFPGFCAVFAQPQTEAAHKRLQAFVNTTDGFRLAELDFQLRGPGEILGSRQHGMPPLRMADLRRDRGILEQARRDAQALVESDPGLAAPQHARLRRMVVARYGKTLDLADVG